MSVDPPKIRLNYSSGALPQVQQRRVEPLVTNGPVRVKACRHGPMMYLAGDSYIGRSFDLYGEFAESEMALLKQFIPEHGVCVDAGANIGAHTVFFGKAVGAYGRVISFEPQRGIYHLLTGNLALNGLLNVEAEHAGVGGHAGFVTVPRWNYDLEQNFGGQRLREYEGAGDRVRVIPIDDLGLTQCDLIKVDVEGMELETLHGAHQTIQRCAPVIYMENNQRIRSVALLRHLMNLGYRLYWHGTFFYNPKNFFASQNNIFGRTVDSNILCLPARISDDFVHPTEDHLFQAFNDPTYWPFNWE